MSNILTMAEGAAAPADPQSEMVQNSFDGIAQY
jgi:hypothetical protein